MLASASLGLAKNLALHPSNLALCWVDLKSILRTLMLNRATMFTPWTSFINPEVPFRIEAERRLRLNRKASGDFPADGFGQDVEGDGLRRANHLPRVDDHLR